MLRLLEVSKTPNPHLMECYALLVLKDLGKLKNLRPMWKSLKMETGLKDPAPLTAERSKGESLSSPAQAQLFTRRTTTAGVDEMDLTKEGDPS